MTDRFDLHASTREVTKLLDGISDDQLDGPTPCTDTSVAAMLDHLMGLTLAFRNAATKSNGPDSGQASAVAANLSPDWREFLPVRLDELATAWDDPDAWTGTTWAGGVEMPAEIMASVALDEVVLHGWDLAKATGQAYEVDPVSTQVVLGFTEASSQPGQEAMREGIFGPVVEVPDDAPAFDRALGFSGRDPRWTPPT
jgi:uncharacterized protein (TIGR03086 family)